MKFKIDENLPKEFAEILNSAGHDALTVIDERLHGANDHRIMNVCKKENRVLVTLDLDFADIRAYPPKEFPGIIVLRVHRQDKLWLLQTFSRVVPFVTKEPIKNHLWIVEESQVRIHGE